MTVEKSQRTKNSKKRPVRRTRAESAFTIPDLMERWQCGYDAVWSRLRRGEIEGMRIGRAWRISPESVARAEANAMKVAAAR